MDTILIVEDDKHLRRLYRSELEGEGYRIVSAKDSKEAKEVVASHLPDLIVMDIRLPGKDGVDAMGEILQEYGKIPVILNSAFSSYQDDFLTWAADAYIIKSSDLSPLKDKIRELLTLRFHGPA
jgi:CheY-like chemotaxis protein